MSAHASFVPLMLVSALLLRPLPPPLPAGEIPRQDWRIISASAQARGESAGAYTASDSAGNCYVAGYGTTTPYGTALFLQKYTPAGQLLWSRTHPGYPGDFLPRGLAVTPQQHILLAAYSNAPAPAGHLFRYDTEGALLQETLFTGPSAPQSGSLSMSVDNIGRCYLATLLSHGGLTFSAYSAAGELLWQHEEGRAASTNRYLHAIAADNHGGLYATGTQYGEEDYTCFLWRYDADGHLQWRVSYDQPGRHSPLDLITGPDGRCYLAAESTPPQGSAYDLLVQCFTMAGAQVWSKRHATGIGNQSGDGQLALGDSAHLFVAGLERGEGPTNAMVLRCYSAAGEKLWQTTCLPEYRPALGSLLGMTKNSTGDLLLLLDAKDRSNPVLLLCYDQQGNRRWASWLPDGGNEEEIAAPVLAAAGQGRCIITGQLRDPTAGTSQLLAWVLDSQGRTLWKQCSAGQRTSNDYVTECRVDASGRLYLLGKSGSTPFLAAWSPAGLELWRTPLAVPSEAVPTLRCLNIDRGGSAFIGGSVADARGRDLFLTIRVSAEGKVLWRHQAAASDQQSCSLYSQELDQQGNLLVTGAVFPRTSASCNTFTFKRDPAGRMLWHAEYRSGDASWVHPAALAVDAEGNTCIALVGSGEHRALLKYDPWGKFCWRAGLNRSATSSDWPQYIAIDPRQNILVWGYTTDLTHGVRQQGILSKFSPAGERLWQRCEGQPDGFLRPIYLGMDARGGATLAGFYQETWEEHHFFVSHIDAGGEQSWYTMVQPDLLQDVFLDNAGRCLLLEKSSTGAREVCELDDQGHVIAAWPLGDLPAARMRCDNQDNLYFASNRNGYGWSFFELARYTRTPETALQLPQQLSLHNYPNPFNACTTIRYALPAPGRARLTIHDRLGREVAGLIDAPHTAGWHEAVWSGAHASGLYFIRLETEAGHVHHKMMLIK